jgi:thiamine biosynthesis lipoprotein
MSTAEAIDEFPCFGSRCGVHVSGEAAGCSAEQAVAGARRALLSWHDQFSRFEPGSELSRLNADPRGEVPVSPLMARLARAVRRAGSLTGGLVDATMLEAIERRGYDHDLGEPLPLIDALRLAPPRHPAGPASAPGFAQVAVDFGRGTVRRPPGLRIDSGGLAKGLFADVLAQALAGHDSFAVNCAGDIALGGSAGAARAVNVDSPFDDATLHTFQLVRGGVATSGIGRRSWIDRSGRPCHHLLDPATGAPAFTGIVQVTALAANALTAETYAKAALLSGPAEAPRWLPAGGVIVLEDGTHIVIEPPPAVTLSELSAYAHQG